MTIPEVPLITQVLRWRGSKSHAARAAQVRRAISPSTELGSLAATEPWMSGVPEYARPGLRRAAAICATATGSAHVPGQRLGTALARLGADEDVAALPMLDLEAAAAVVHQLMIRCSGKGIGVDWNDVARTLTWWGNGIDDRSRRTRERIVFDYHQGPRPEPINPTVDNQTEESPR